MDVRATGGHLILRLCVERTEAAEDPLCVRAGDHGEEGSYVFADREAGPLRARRPRDSRQDAGATLAAELRYGAKPTAAVPLVRGDFAGALARETPPYVQRNHFSARINETPPQTNNT